MILFCVIAKLTRNDELTGKSAIQGNNRVFLHKVKFLIPTLWVKFFFFFFMKTCYLGRTALWKYWRVRSITNAWGHELATESEKIRRVIKVK